MSRRYILIFFLIFIAAVDPAGANFYTREAVGSVGEIVGLGIDIGKIFAAVVRFFHRANTSGAALPPFLGISI